jgi:hypothetical protein
MVILAERKFYNTWTDATGEVKVYWPMSLSIKLPIRFLVDYDVRNFLANEILPWDEDAHEEYFPSDECGPFTTDLDNYAATEDCVLPREFIEYRELVKNATTIKERSSSGLTVADAMNNADIDILEVYVLARIEDMMKATRKTYIRTQDIPEISNARYIDTLRRLKETGQIVWNLEHNGIALEWAAKQHDEFIAKLGGKQLAHDSSIPPFSLARAPSSSSSVVGCDFGRAVDVFVDQKMIASTMLHPWCISVVIPKPEIRCVSADSEINHAALKTKTRLSVSLFGRRASFAGNYDFIQSVKLLIPVLPHFNKGEIVNMQRTKNKYRLFRENSNKTVTEVQVSQDVVFRHTHPASCCDFDYLPRLRTGSVQCVIIHEHRVHSRWLRECVRVAGGVENVIWITNNAPKPSPVATVGGTTTTTAAAKKPRPSALADKPAKKTKAYKASRPKRVQFT